MRILVTGAGGMLGQDLTRALAAAGHRITALAHADFDITDAAAVGQRIREERPDVVANCAAFTRVDDCENRAGNAFAVNARGPRHLAVACHTFGAALLHMSTDYVFPGSEGRPYRESDLPAPLNRYGDSKWAGEQMVRAACPRHWIVRTQWLFGAGGTNFVRTILRLAREGNPLAVVDDQFGSPTFTADLAAALAELVATPTYGTYHLTNSGVCSWFAFAQEILALAGLGHLPLRPHRTLDLRRPAPRPLFSVLDNDRWRLEGRLPLRNWREALAAFLEELNREARRHHG